MRPSGGFARLLRPHGYCRFYRINGTRALKGWVGPLELLDLVVLRSTIPAASADKRKNAETSNLENAKTTIESDSVDETIQNEALGPGVVQCKIQPI